MELTGSDLTTSPINPTGKKNFFGLAPSLVRIPWPRGYEKLDSYDNSKRKAIKGRRARPAIRLGRRRKAIIVGLCRRFPLRVRILSRAFGLAFFRRLKSLYATVLEELKEAGPGMEAVNTGALVNAHFSIASLPASVPSMASVGF